MPNRIIKDSIHGSEKVNKLTDFQFRLWVNLITYVDDYGRGDARPAIIKGTCFPLRDRITNKDIQAALESMAGIGCIGLYEVDGRPYLYFPRWELHQTIRNKRSKFPAPDIGKTEIESNCIQLQANVPVIQSQSESESESEDGCTAQTPAFAPVPPMPLNDGTVYRVTVDDLEKWRSLYPAVDIEQQLRNMTGWLDANPNNRKTRNGIHRFIAAWLSKEQNGAKKQNTGYTKQSAYSTAPSYDISRAEQKAKTSVPTLTKKERR